MTETDATRKPLEMPERFIPYLEKYRIYKVFKDMMRDLVVNLPKDHLKHMKVFFSRHQHSSRDADRVMLLVSPELKIDIKPVVKQMIKDLGFFVITRRCVMDRYEKHDDYVPGCVSPPLMSEVTKTMTLKDPVPQAGWLMFGKKNKGKGKFNFDNDCLSNINNREELAVPIHFHAGV